MTTKKERICWDSCVFIDLLQKVSGRIAFVDPIVRLAKTGKLAIVASTMAIVETVNVKNIQPLEQICLIEDLFRQKYIHVRIMDRPVAKRAQGIRRTNKSILPPDAVHLATALESECSYFLTMDGANPRNRGALLPLDKTIEGLRIVTPEKYLEENYSHLNGSYSLVAKDA